MAINEHMETFTIGQAAERVKAEIDRMEPADIKAFLQIFFDLVYQQGWKEGYEQAIESGEAK